MQAAHHSVLKKRSSRRTKSITLVVVFVIVVTNVVIIPQLRMLTIMTTASNTNIMDDDNKNSAASTLLLQQQMTAQSQFQEYLRTSQNPDDCDTARYLYQKPRELDGFSLEVQDMARLLQVAVATNRTLLISSEWRSAYEPPNACQWDNQTTNTADVNDTAAAARVVVVVGWSCLWNPVTHCTEESLLKSKNRPTTNIITTTTSSLTTTTTTTPGPLAGIIKTNAGGRRRRGSKYFNTAFYGSKPVVDAPRWQWKEQSLIDVIPHWERIYGRFWIRAQTAQYLWNPSDGLQRQIDKRMPPELLVNVVGKQEQQQQQQEPFIAFHIRLTDNINDLQKDFGRNATITRDVSQFMRIASTIRSQHASLMNLKRIFIATDNKDVLNKIFETNSSEYKDWTFFSQQHVQRSNRKDLMWFRNGRSSAAAAIATDIEVMRRATFLVGSFQSNVYRLAAELNTAWHVAQYPIHMQRHYTVDVEWYEDP